MRRLLTFSLCIFVLAAAVFTGCTKADRKQLKPVKFGSGMYVSAPSATDASEDKDGAGKIDVTVAAVTVNENGKIMSCALDTASYTVKYTFDGKAIANGEFKTKYETGKDYNMVVGGASKEWYEQADAFEAVVAGKTIDEVKALVAQGNKGTEEVMNAGCTIMINEFVAAIEKAYNNASAEVDSNHLLKVNVATEQTITDAAEEKDGSNKLTVNVFAAAQDASGKVSACSSDCVEVSFTFDMNGVSTLDTTKPVVSKKEHGYDYGMVAYGASDREWFEQAAAFDSVCVGKTAAEIASAAVEDFQKAGCTIDVSGLVKAAVKH